MPSPDYSRFYARFHPDDPRHFIGLHLLTVRMLQPHLPADYGAPILDVGCGRGLTLSSLSRLGYTNLTGIDNNPGQIAHARLAGANAAEVADTVEYLRARPNSFAAILLLDVLEHFPPHLHMNLLEAIALSLKPGGRLICTVPNAASAIMGYWLYNDYTHQGCFTDDSLGFLLESAGFATVRCSSIEFTLRPRFLFWWPSSRSIAWWLRCWVRARQRLTFIGELGWARGRQICLTPNVLAVAVKA